MLQQNTATRNTSTQSKGDATGAAAASSNVSSMLAQRARQSTVQADDGGARSADAAPGDPHAGNSPATLSPENTEELRKLTQQAQRDVQALVEALKQAEKDSATR